MKKKILIALGILAVPVGVLFLNACGPEGMTDSALTLDEASDNWIPTMLNEWGRCEDGWDNDGDGLKDMEDPDCHVALSPLRDLSLLPFPEGHNFLPDIAIDLPGGPGWDGSFRNRAQIARWIRFLTEPAGNVAGINVYDPGVNPEVVPLPNPLPDRIDQGTSHQGNNNNLSVRGLHNFYLDHPFVAGPAAAAIAPSDLPEPYAALASEIVPLPPYDQTQPAIGFPGWPGQLYRSQGVPPYVPLIDTLPGPIVDGVGVAPILDGVGVEAPFATGATLPIGGGGGGSQGALQSFKDRGGNDHNGREHNGKAYNKNR